MAPLQAPEDSIQSHYQAAQNYHNAGKPDQAEVEYKAALGEAYRALGRILLAEGEYQKAVKALERATPKSSGSEEALIDLATSYFHTQQYEKAIDPLKKVLAVHPGSQVAHHLLGKSYFMLRQFDRAASELGTALRLAPRDVDIAYTLALAHLKRKQLIPARQVFVRLLRNLGDRPEVHNLFGRAYRETNYLDEAIVEFKKTLAQDPRFPRARYNLGLSYLLKDGTLKLKEAAAEFSAELALNPEEFLAIYNLALIHVVERRYEEGAGLLEKAARLRPQNPNVWLFLGNAYHGLGRYHEAIESLQKSMSLNPDMDKTSPQAAEAHFLLGQSLVRAGRAEEGEKELEAARELKAKALATDREKIVAYLNTEEYRGGQSGPGEEDKLLVVGSAPDPKMKEKLRDSEVLYRGVVAKIHNQTGLLYAERQDFRGAVEQFLNAVDWDSSLKGANYNLGLAYYRIERYKEAISPLEAEVRNEPANVSAKHLLGMCYFVAEDYARASALLTEVLPARSNNVSLYYTLTLSLLKEDRVSEARDVIQRMLVMAGDSAQIHILLGQAYHAQNEDLKALEELRRASEMDSRLPMAHYYSGLIYVKAGKFDDATREFEAELAVNPKDVQAKYHLGFVLLSKGQTDRGMSLMREVIEADPRFADARFELGKAMLLQGDVKGAIENLEEAARLGPDKAHIHYQLGRAYVAAGREADAQKRFQLFKELKDKERNRTNP